MMNRRSGGILAAFILLVFMASTLTVGTAHGAPTTITAYKSTIPVSLSSPYSASQWTDTQTIKDPYSGLTFAAKQNGTGWLFFISYTYPTAGFYTDTACYGGIELDTSSNTGEMGTPTTPSLMILASPLFQTQVGHAVDEFISTGDTTPTSVEASGYATQSVCGALTLTGTTYTVQCYRSFALKNASPQDPTANMNVGSTVEIGFALGEFNHPGTHAATSMSTYVLTFSSSTFTGSTTSTSSTSSTSTSTTTSTSSTTSTTTTTTTTTTSSTHSTTTTTSSTPTTTTTTTTTTSSTHSTTSTSTSSTPTTTSTAASTSTAAYTLKVTTNAASYQNTQTGTITATATPSLPAGTLVLFQITNPYGTIVFASTVAATAGVSPKVNFTAQSLSYIYWVGGTYVVTASFSVSGATVSATTQFTYSGSSAAPLSTTSSATVTVTSTATGPVTTVTGPPSTVTAVSTVAGPVTTISSVSTVPGPVTTVTSVSTTTTTSTSTPVWAYGMMVLLLAIGLAVGYVVKRPAPK